MGRRAVLWAGSRSAEEASPSPVYGAALLMRFGFTPIRGSNPRASAAVTWEFVLTARTPRIVSGLTLHQTMVDPMMVPAVGDSDLLNRQRGPVRVDFAGQDVVEGALCVPSICDDKTASRRTYMATKSSGLGNVAATPSRRPSAVPALASTVARLASKASGGSGGSGAGMNAWYRSRCRIMRPARFLVDSGLVTARDFSIEADARIALTCEASRIACCVEIEHGVHVKRPLRRSRRLLQHDYIAARIGLERTAYEFGGERVMRAGSGAGAGCASQSASRYELGGPR
jgi:hypothetical protein